MTPDIYKQQANKYANKVLRLDDEEFTYTFNGFPKKINLLKINSVLYVRIDSFYRLQEGLVSLMKGKSPQLTKSDILHIFPKSGKTVRKYIDYQTLLKVSGDIRTSFFHSLIPCDKEFDYFLNFIGKFCSDSVTNTKVPIEELSESTTNYFKYLGYLAISRKFRLQFRKKSEHLSSNEERQVFYEKFSNEFAEKFASKFVKDHSFDSVDSIIEEALQVSQEEFKNSQESNISKKEVKAVQKDSNSTQDSSGYSEQDSSEQNSSEKNSSEFAPLALPVQYDVVASNSALSSEALSHVRALEKLGWHVALYKL